MRTVAVYESKSGELLGRLSLRPGVVSAGQIAVVRTPQDSVIRRVYYYREGGREMVRLVSLLTAVAPVCLPLADVEVLGEVLDCTRAYANPWDELGEEWEHFIAEQGGIA